MHRAPTAEVTRKILIVGGKATGKTSFIRRFVDKPLAGLQYVPTIGVDVIVYPLSPAREDAPAVHLQFWDVSHQELAASASHHALLCTNVAGIFLVLDVSNRESLAAVDAWQHLLSQYVPMAVPRVLLAHKADLINEASCCVNDKLLETYKRAAGLTDWCYTVGHEYFGDYVANRSSKSRPVADAVQLLVEHIFLGEGGGGGEEEEGGGGGTTRRRSGSGGGRPSRTGSLQQTMGTTTNTAFSATFRSSQCAAYYVEDDEAEEEEEEDENTDVGGPGETPPSAMTALRYLRIDEEEERVKRRRQQALAAASVAAAATEAGAEGSPPPPPPPSRRRPRRVVSCYQPLQGWLPSVDLEILFDQSPATSATLETFRRQYRKKRHAEKNTPTAVAAASSRLLQASSSSKPDAGWRHLAGSLGRTEAERLLRTKPVGAFLLRRFDERALRLSYKTQYSVEHAPIVYSPEVGGWTHVRSAAATAASLAASTAPNTPQSSSSTRSERLERERTASGGGSSSLLLSPTLQKAQLVGQQASSLVPPQGPPPPTTGRGSRADRPPPPQSFETLEELLRFFSKKAMYGLCFRRVPGTCDYEVVEEEGEGKAGPGGGGQGKGETGAAAGGGGGMLGWFHRRVVSQSVVPSKDGAVAAEPPHPHMLEEEAPPPPPPIPPTAEDVHGLFSSLRRVLVVVEAAEKEEKEGKETQQQHEALLRVCDKSREDVLGALSLSVHGGWKQPRASSTAAQEEEGEAEPTSLSERISLLDVKLCELLSSLNALLLLEGQTEEDRKGCLGALHTLGRWRPFLETLRLRIESETTIEEKGEEDETEEEEEAEEPKA